MSKSSHFSGQPLYGQVIKLPDKSKILHYSREKGGERYTKRFDCWIHPVVMLYAVIIRIPGEARSPFPVISVHSVDGLMAQS